MSTKTKMWMILQLLMESDEHYPLTAEEIASKLASRYNIEAERKSIYRDIKTLQNECGLDICTAGGAKRGYYLASRDFEDWELKILMDAVLDMRFLPQKDAVRIVEKLKHQGSRYSQEVLHAITPVKPVSRPENKGIKRFIDRILTAVKDDCKIAFRYFDFQPDGTKIYRRDRRRYFVNPYALVLRNGMYYLVANYIKYDDLGYFRLDRIDDLSLLPSPRRPLREILGPNPSEALSNFVNRSPFIFSGEEIHIQLAIPASMTDQLLFQFGKDDVSLSELPAPDDYGFAFCADIRMQESSGLYYWLLQQADHCRILGPEDVKEEFVRYVKFVLSMYEEGDSP